MRFTITFAGPGTTSHGTCAVIWPSETDMSGAANPFIVTELTSLSAVESGMELATERPAAKPLPKIEMSEPADTVVLTELIV